MIVRLRRVILFTCMVISYLVFLVLLMGWDIWIFGWGVIHPLVGMILCLLFFVLCVCLSVPDLRIFRTSKRTFLFLFLLVSVCVVKYVEGGGDPTMFLETQWARVLGGIIILAGIVLLFRTKIGSMENRIRLNSRVMTYSGVWMFSWFVSAMIALVSVGGYTSLPFSCDQIQSTSDQFFSVLASPFKVGYDTVQSVSQRTTDFLEQNIGNVLVGSGDALQNLKIESSTGSIEITLPEGELPEFGGIVGSIDALKYRILAQINERKELNQSVCQVTMDLIQDKWKKPGVRYSIAVILMFLLSPFVGITFVVISMIAFLLFGLFRLGGVWKYVEVMKWVEDIE